jgi:hypothetical protein
VITALGSTACARSFQTVFYHGASSTISPVLMNSRTDGVLREVFISPSFGRVRAVAERHLLALLDDGPALLSLGYLHRAI